MIILLSIVVLLVAAFVWAAWFDRQLRRRGSAPGDIGSAVRRRQADEQGRGKGFPTSGDGSGPGF